MSLHASGSSALGVDADEELSLEDTVGVDVAEPLWCQVHHCFK